MLSHYVYWDDKIHTWNVNGALWEESNKEIWSDLKASVQVLKWTKSEIRGPKTAKSEIKGLKNFWKVKSAGLKGSKYNTWGL